MAEHKVCDMRSLILKAIGPYRTHQEFAQTIGISRGHLSRLLNHPESRIPSNRTMGAIARGSEGRVTYEELYQAAFGVLDEDGNATSITLRATIFEGIQRLMKRRYQSLAAFCTRLRQESPRFLSCTVQRVEYGETSAEPLAEGTCFLLILCLSSEKAVRRFYIRLYFCETGLGNILIVGYSQ